MRLTNQGNERKFSWQALAILLLAVIVSGACRRRTVADVPTPPVPEPPKPAAPTVTITVEPSTIQAGQSATVKWSSTNATDLDLQPAFGRVERQGQVTVSPKESITYTLTGRGTGGTNSATARLTVTAAPVPPAITPPAPDRSVSQREQFEQNAQDAFFDYDQSDLRDDGRSALMKTAAFLKTNGALTIQIEGHCDERGSVAYNLGLGDRRANSARDFLVQQGVSADRITTISYGKEKPFCTEASESCFQENRRAHMVCTNCGM